MICQLTSICYITFHVFKFSKKTFVTICVAARQLEVGFVRAFRNFHIVYRFKCIFIGSVKTLKMLLNFMNPFTRENSIFSFTQIYTQQNTFCLFLEHKKKRGKINKFELFLIVQNTFYFLSSRFTVIQCDVVY